MKSETFILEVAKSDTLSQTGYLFFLREVKTGKLVKVSCNVSDFEHLLDD